MPPCHSWEFINRSSNSTAADVELRSWTSCVVVSCSRSRWLAKSPLRLPSGKSVKSNTIAISGQSSRRIASPATGPMKSTARRGCVWIGAKILWRSWRAGERPLCRAAVVKASCIAGSVPTTAMCACRRRDRAANCRRPRSKRSGAGSIKTLPSPSIGRLSSRGAGPFQP